MYFSLQFENNWKVVYVVDEFSFDGYWNFEDGLGCGVGTFLFTWTLLGMLLSP